MRKLSHGEETFILQASARDISNRQARFRLACYTYILFKRARSLCHIFYLEEFLAYLVNLASMTDMCHDFAMENMIFSVERNTRNGLFQFFVQHVGNSVEHTIGIYAGNADYGGESGATLQLPLCSDDIVAVL